MNLVLNWQINEWGAFFMGLKDEKLSKKLNLERDLFTK